MPRFSDVIGQEMAIAALERSIVGGSVAHAYLFTGPAGVGKLTTALAFASALNCAEKGDGVDACGQCWSCRAIAELQHPDLEILSPTGAGEETTIKQTREMIASSGFAPLRGNKRVAIIERAETLNEESSSSILKILEEPPDYLVIILLTSNPSIILDTIRSRCQRIRLVPVPIRMLRDRLVQDHGATEVDAEFLAAYSEGRPGRAISLVGNTDFFGRRDELIKLVYESSTPGSRWRILKLAETLRNLAEKDEEAGSQSRRRLLAAIDMLILWYRDLLTVKLSGENAPVINTDRRDELVRQSAMFKTTKRLTNALHVLTHGKKAIAGNANLQIATETVMLALTR